MGMVKYSSPSSMNYREGVCTDQSMTQSCLLPQGFLCGEEIIQLKTIGTCHLWKSLTKEHWSIWLARLLLAAPPAQLLETKEIESGTSYIYGRYCTIEQHSFPMYDVYISAHSANSQARTFPFMILERYF